MLRLPIHQRASINQLKRAGKHNGGVIKCPLAGPRLLKVGEASGATLRFKRKHCLGLRWHRTPSFADPNGNTIQKAANNPLPMTPGVIVHACHQRLRTERFEMLTDQARFAQHDPTAQLQRGHLGSRIYLQQIVRRLAHRHLHKTHGSIEQQRNDSAHPRVG